MKWREKHEGFKGQRIVVVPRPILATALLDPLLRNLAPTDAGYYPKAKGHTCARERGCPEAIFIYCADGSGWCELSGRRHDVASNQLLVIPAFAPHVYGAAKKTPWTIHWFRAVGSNVPFYLERLGVTEAKPVVPHGRGIGAQAKNACVLTRDYPSECGTVRKILMQDLVKLGMRDAQLPASDSRYALDGGVIEHVA